MYKGAQQSLWMFLVYIFLARSHKNVFKRGVASSSSILLNSLVEGLQHCSHSRLWPRFLHLSGLQGTTRERDASKTTWIWRPSRNKHDYSQLKPLKINFRLENHEFWRGVPIRGQVNTYHCHMPTDCVMMLAWFLADPGMWTYVNIRECEHEAATTKSNNHHRPWQQHIVRWFAMHEPRHLEVMVFLPLASHPPRSSPVPGQHRWFTDRSTVPKVSFYQPKHITCWSQQSTSVNLIMYHQWVSGCCRLSAAKCLRSADLEYYTLRMIDKNCYIILVVQSFGDAL